MKIKYKILESGMKSPYQDFRYKSGRVYHCDNFDIDKNAACSHGFYATDIEGLPYAFRPSKCVWECEVSGREVRYDIYKWRFENIKLIRRLTKSEVLEQAKATEKKCGYRLSEILYPVYPLNRKDRKGKCTDKQIELLKQWDSVGDSVGASVWDSVGASVWDSVWAYISSLFPNIKKWKYIGHKSGVNPFQSGIDLWRSGFVPSFDSTTWRLHTGPKAEIVYTLPVHGRGKEGEES